MAQVDEEVDGRDLVDRAPEAATELLNQAFAAIERAAGAGVPPTSLNPLRDRVDAGLDRIYAVARIGEASTLVDLATPFPGVAPSAMVAASDGSLWVADSGRGRLIRIDRPTVARRSSTAPARRSASWPPATRGCSPPPPPTWCWSTASGRRGASTSASRRRSR